MSLLFCENLPTSTSSPLHPSPRFHSACDPCAIPPSFKSVAPPRVCSEGQKGGVCGRPAPPPLRAQPSREGAAASVCSRCRPNDALMPYVRSRHLLSRLTFRPTAPSNKRRRRGPSSTLAFESTAVGKGEEKKKKDAFHFAFVDRSARIPPSLPRLRRTSRVSPRACARRRSSASLIRICRLASSADSF